MQLRRGYFSLFIFLLSSTILFAQESRNGGITGSVIDKPTRHPMEYVNVILRNQADSTLIKGVVTDQNGNFTFRNVPHGDYVVQCRFVGYADLQTPVFAIDVRHPNLALGALQMVESTLYLKELVVSAEKVTFNNAIDRKVYNVDQDIMSKTGSASQLLQNIPSVEVDIDGNVKLRGSSNVEIYINGKPSPLMGKSRASVLQQLPASAIERIEVITNPSAKFKPEGTSGIINIVLKKQTKKGVNGSLNASGGNGRRYHSGLRGNDNFGKVNLYGSYDFKKDDRTRFSSQVTERSGTAFQLLSVEEENRRSFARPASHMARLGIDVDPNAANRLGISLNYYHKGFTQRDTTSRAIKDGSGVVAEDYDRNRLDFERETETGVTAYYQHNFDKEDHELRIEGSASHVPEEEDNHFTETYRVPGISPLYDNTLIKQTETQADLSIDYTNPLSETSKLEAGFSGNLEKRDLDFYGAYYDTDLRTFVMDVQKTNRFLLDQTILGLYGTYAHAYGAFRFEGGLRAEQAFVNVHLVTTDTRINHPYFDLFPTLHLGYALGESAEFQMSYSRRIRRPEEDELNPFSEYRDPRNLEAGNPNLLPESIHSTEAGFQWENDRISVISTVYYRYKYNGITSITESINDSTLLTTRKNLSNDQSGGVECIFSGNTGRFLNVHLSSNAYYNQIDASNIGFGKKRKRISWSGTLNLNVHVTEVTQFQINAQYRSSRVSTQGEYRPRIVVNTGMRQDLFQKKVAVVLSVSDLFKTLNQKAELQSPGLHKMTNNRRDTRVIYLGATYNFGSNAKRKEAEPQYDDQL